MTIDRRRSGLCYNRLCSLCTVSKTEGELEVELCHAAAPFLLVAAAIAVSGHHRRALCRVTNMQSIWVHFSGKRSFEVVASSNNGANLEIDLTNAQEKKMGLVVGRALLPVGP